MKKVLSIGGIEIRKKRERRTGRVKKSLNQATRYSSSSLTAFFVRASLVARKKADKRA